MGCCVAAADAVEIPLCFAGSAPPGAAVVSAPLRMQSFFIQLTVAGLRFIGETQAYAQIQHTYHYTQARNSLCNTH